MSSQPSGKAVFILLLVGLIGFGALAAYVGTNQNARRVPDEMRRDSSPEVSTRRSTPPRSQTPATPNYWVAGLQAEEVKLVPFRASLRSGEDPKLRLTRESLEALGISGDAKALGISVEQGVAVISVNEGFVNRGYSSTEEGNLVKALQLVLGQFKEIEKFQIMEEGQPIESLGHFELTEPLPVIRPGQEQPTTPSAG